jgi:hypothetical protein
MAKRVILLLFFLRVSWAGVCSNTSLGNAVNCIQSASTGGNGAAVSVNLPSTPSIGQVVLIGCTKYNTTAGAILAAPTDNQGNTYAVDADRHPQAAGFPYKEAQLSSSRIATAAGTFTASCHTASGSDYMEIAVLVLSGLSPGTFLDVVASGDSGGGVATSLTPSSGNATTTGLDLLVGVATTSGGSSQTWSAGAGYTLLEQIGSTTNTTIGTEGQTSTAGSHSAAFGLSIADTWVAVMAAYKIGAAAPAPVRHKTTQSE